MIRFTLLITVSFLVCLACSAPESTKDINPPAEGFNLVDSDSTAIRIADEVMVAMGGRDAWDRTRYIRWNFFGRRDLTWDKHGQRCRIEIPGEDLVMVINLKDNVGMARRGDKVFSASDSLDFFVNRAREIWINDSYWLVMPYKLKDSGVTLRHIGRDTTMTGDEADLLELTFEAVGVTPQNRYVVYVNPNDKLITQWDFYTTAQDTAARFSTPWADYQKRGEIMLSGDRGRFALSNIEVLEELPETVFTSLD